MKKIIVFVFSIFLIGNVFAATNEAEIDQKQVEKLKEKIELQTKKMRNKIEKVIAGFIKELNDKSFVLEKGSFEIDDKLTRYFKVSKGKITEVDKDSFKKGDYIFAVGPELEGKLNVLEVYKDDYYEILSGVILEVNKKEYFLRVLTELKTEKIVDIEKFTKQLILKDDFEFKRTKFSKIKENDYIIFIFKKAVKKDEDRVSAEKILVIPQELIERLRADKLK